MRLTFLTFTPDIIGDIQIGTTARIDFGKITEESYKKILGEINLYLRFSYSNVSWNEETFFYTDKAIKGVAEFGWYGGGQGSACSCTKFYGDDNAYLGYARAKPNISALDLAIGIHDAPDAPLGDFDIKVSVVCVDPRIVATDIFVNALAMMCPGVPNDIKSILEETNAVLNPTFSFDEAFEFLEKNRFIGENSKKNAFVRDVRAGKRSWSEAWGSQREVWEESPGWWTWRCDTLEYIPPKMRGIYEKLREMWEKYESEQEAERRMRAR